MRPRHRSGVARPAQCRDLEARRVGRRRVGRRRVADNSERALNIPVVGGRPLGDRAVVRRAEAAGTMGAAAVAGAIAEMTAEVAGAGARPAPLPL